MDWRELLQCAVCLRPFDVVRLPVSLICGHTICCPCLSACSLHAPTSADTSNSRHGKASLAPSRSFASKDEHGFHSGAPEGLWKTNGHNGDKNGYWPDGKNVGSGHGDIKTYGNMRSYQCPLDQVLHKIPLVELPVNLSFLRILRIPFGSNTTNNRSLCGHVLSGFGSSNGQYDECEIEMMYRAGASSERPDGPQQMPSWMFAGLHGRDDDFGNQQYSQEKSLLVREDATEEQIPLPHSTDRNDFTRTSNGDEVHLSGSANSETEEDAYRGAQEALNSLASVMSLRDTGYPPQVLNKPLQRKILALLQCQIALPEGRMKCIRAARSVCERVVVELIVQHQNQQQLTSHLWSAVRARGCQFLGPAMQEEVLKLVLLALETGSALSRKVLVMFIVQKLKPQYPQASKTSVGHVVQLLYRASCFKVSKRDGDSSLMELKDEFRTYDALRKEHDAQIIQIAQEAGLRIAPEQWSALLYGDHLHKSLMQSIIDKLQSTQFFAQSVQELLIAVQRSGDPGNLCSLRSPLDQLASLDTTPDVHSAPEKKEAPSMHVVATTVNNIVRVITTFLAFMNAALLKKELLHPARMRAGAESTENMLCLNRTEPTGHPTHQSLSATRSLPQHIIGQNNGVDGFSGHLMDNGTMSVVDLNRLISRPNPVSLHVLKMSPPSVGENQNVSPHNTTRNPLLNGLASPGSLRPISRQASAPVRTRLDCYSQSPPSHNLYSGARFQNNNSCHQENGSFSLEEDFYSAQARGKREQAALSQSTHKALQASNSLSNSFSSDLWNGSSVHGHVENGPRNRSTKLTPPLAFSRRMPASSGNLLDEFARWRDDASTSQGIHRISSLSNDLHRLHISRSAVFENDSLRPSYADNCSNIPLDYPYQDLSTIGKSFSSLSGDTPHMLRNQQRQADMDTSNRNWETCLFSLADEESQADRLNM